MWSRFESRMSKFELLTTIGKQHRVFVLSGQWAHSEYPFISRRRRKFLGKMESVYAIRNKRISLLVIIIPREISVRAKNILLLPKIIFLLRTLFLFCNLWSVWLSEASFLEETFELKVNSICIRSTITAYGNSLAARTYYLGNFELPVQLTFSALFS